MKNELPAKKISLLKIRWNIKTEVWSKMPYDFKMPNSCALFEYYYKTQDELQTIFKVV